MLPFPSTVNVMDVEEEETLISEERLGSRGTITTFSQKIAGCLTFVRADVTVDLQ